MDVECLQSWLDVLSNKCCYQGWSGSSDHPGGRGTWTWTWVFYLTWDSQAEIDFENINLTWNFTVKISSQVKCFKFKSQLEILSYKTQVQVQVLSQVKYLLKLSQVIETWSFK